MQIETRENIQGITVSVHGEIELTTLKPFRQRIFEILEASKGDMEIDCADLMYIDSSGIKVLLDMVKALKEQNRSLQLSNVSDKIYRVLEFSTLRDIIV